MPEIIDAKTMATYTVTAIETDEDRELWTAGAEDLRAGIEDLISQWMVRNEDMYTGSELRSVVREALASINVTALFLSVAHCEENPDATG